MEGQTEFAADLKDLENWGLCTDTMMNWFYQMRYLNYASYFDTINFISKDFYAFVLNCGSIYALNQGDWQGETITSFGILNEYVFSKMMWDSSLSMETLCKKFFNAMYKDAADTMYDIFNDLRIHSATISQDSNVTEWCGTTADYANLYPYTSYLKPMIDKFEKALSEIENLKYTAPNEYELVKKRIETEYVAPLYMALNYYGKSEARPFDAATKLLYKQKLQAITEEMSFKISELSPDDSALKDFADGV